MIVSIGIIAGAAFGYLFAGIASSYFAAAADARPGVAARRRRRAGRRRDRRVADARRARIARRRAAGAAIGVDRHDATIVLPLHILAGVFALLFGYIALYATKGATLHRKSGMVFVFAMVVMSLTGALIAALKPDRGIDHRRTADVLFRDHRPADRDAGAAARDASRRSPMV